jgi:hypothetical protein
LETDSSHSEKWEADIVITGMTVSSQFEIQGDHGPDDGGSMHL